MVRVGVLGAGGKMGREVCRAVAGDPDLELVAAIDSHAAGIEVDAAVHVGSDIEELASAGADVAVDFTVAASAAANMRWCAAHGVHAVVGTTGIGAEELSEIEALFDASEANCIIAANFAIGAVLMMRFAAMAAPFMNDAEIIELHHDAKLDAPSGTALRTAEQMEQARESQGGPWPPDRTSSQPVQGTRGGVGPGGVHIHSVRLPGLVAHQEVLFGALGQSLTLRHDAYDRTSFMPGVLLAVRSVGGRPGLTVGLDALLGF